VSHRPHHLPALKSSATWRDQIVALGGTTLNSDTTGHPEWLTVIPAPLASIGIGLVMVDIVRRLANVACRSWCDRCYMNTRDGQAVAPLSCLLRRRADAGLPPRLAPCRAAGGDGTGSPPACDRTWIRTRRLSCPDLTIFSRALGQPCSSKVQQPHRPATTRDDRYRPLSCLNDLYRLPCP